MAGVRRFLGAALAMVASYYGMSPRAIIILSILVLLMLFVVIPTFFRYNKTIQRHMIFLPWVKWPKHVDFDRPEDEGLEGAVNFYLDTPDGARIGVWHVLPGSMVEEGRGKDREWYELQLGKGVPIVIYMHGNTGSRAREHRVEMYRVLRARLGCHVVCFDYRGYADSSQEVMPTKRGVVTDGHRVYEHVASLAGDRTPIFVWGHSLGTGVSSAVVADLCSRFGNGGAGGDSKAATNTTRLPRALVLESPFNNIRDEIRVHPMTALWRKMPWFEWFFTGTLNKSDVAFRTDELVHLIHLPVLIFHARDDAVVPFQLGEKLYKAFVESRNGNDSDPARPESVRFVDFPEDLGYAHVNIHLAPELPDIVEDFFKSAVGE